jgi:hypothetical protein
MRASEWRVLALRLWMWDMIVQSTIYKSRREFQAEIRADGSGTGDPRHPDTNPYPMVTKDGTAQSLTLTQFGTASVTSHLHDPVSSLVSAVKCQPRLSDFLYRPQPAGYTHGHPHDSPFHSSTLAANRPARSALSKRTLRANKHSCQSMLSAGHPPTHPSPPPPSPRPSRQPP